MSKQACEFRRSGEEPCGVRAYWLVARGRSYDAQLSCRTHLSATIVAVLEGSARVHVTVTDVTRNAVTQLDILR